MSDSVYPTSLDTFVDPVATDARNDVTKDHALNHRKANDALAAIETKLGIDSSAVEGSVDERLADLEAAGGAPAGSGQSVRALGRANLNTSPGASDDEFTAGSISGSWTNVQRAAGTNIFTQRYQSLWYRTKQNGTGGDLHALVKAHTFSNGDYIETAIAQNRIAATDNGLGLILADGNTFAAGNQLVMWFHSTAVRLSHGTNYSGWGGSTNDGQALPRNNIAYNSAGLIFMRLKYVSSNTFAAYLSNDGMEWAQIGNNITPTLAPTYMGVVYVNWDSISTPALAGRFCYFRLNQADEAA